MGWPPTELLWVLLRRTWPQLPPLCPLLRPAVFSPALEAACTCSIFSWVLSGKGRAGLGTGQSHTVQNSHLRLLTVSESGCHGSYLYSQPLSCREKHFLVSPASHISCKLLVWTVGIQTSSAITVKHDHRTRPRCNSETGVPFTS